MGVLLGTDSATSTIIKPIDRTGTDTAGKDLLLKAGK